MVVWASFGTAFLWDWNEKLTFCSPVVTAEFSKFAGILSTAFSQQHLLGFETAQLEFQTLPRWLMMLAGEKALYTCEKNILTTLFQCLTLCGTCSAKKTIQKQISCVLKEFIVLIEIQEGIWCVGRRRTVEGYKEKGEKATTKVKEHVPSVSALRLKGQQIIVWIFLMPRPLQWEEERSCLDLMSPLGTFFVVLNSESPF